MSLHVSAAHSSRIKKSKLPIFRSISPHPSLPRRNQMQRPRKKLERHEKEDDKFINRLDDVGPVGALATDLTLHDVPQAIQYIQDQMFSPIPRYRAGMNSSWVAEVLNFRKSLPPIVSIGHIQTLLNSPTDVEREIAVLITAGIVRKFIIPGRGVIGEVLVLVKDLEIMIRENETLNEDTKKAFIKQLQENPSALNIPHTSLSAPDAKALMHAGFLTSTTQCWTPAEAFSRPGNGSRGLATSLDAISRAASGSLAAVGGEGALHAAGGSGGGVQHRVESFTLALPSTGPFLKLLTGARLHLISLLTKSKFRDAPESFLREQWDGGVAADDKEEINRGGGSSMLHGRTSKWKKFYGLKFGYILEECVGAGLVEVFQTKSVGRGVRAV